MPQMAPLMWQTLFLTMVVLLIIAISKNYFTEMKGTSKSMGNRVISSEKTLWKW